MSIPEAVSHPTPTDWWDSTDEAASKLRVATRFSASHGGPGAPSRRRVVSFLVSVLGPLAEAEPATPVAPHVGLRCLRRFAESARYLEPEVGGSIEGCDAALAEAPSALLRAVRAGLLLVDATVPEVAASWASCAMEALVEATGDSATLCTRIRAAFPELPRALA